MSMSRNSSGCFARIAFAALCGCVGLTLSAQNVFLKHGVKDGHFADPTIWQNDTLPVKGDTARLYWAEIGGTVQVSTEEDWSVFTNISEAVLYYGSQLTLDTATDRTAPRIGGGVNGKNNKLFKKGSGKLTMATMSLKGITEIQEGCMKLGPTMASDAGVYDVAEGATLEMPSDRITYILGLRGAGTVTGSGGKQLAFVTTGYTGKDPEVMPPHRFTGKLTGKIDLTVGMQEGTTRGADQIFDTTDTADLSGALRIYKGFFSIKKIGTKTASDPTSLGNLAPNFNGCYNEMDDVVGLRYLGTEPETTDKTVALSYLDSKPGRYLCFDAGAFGGLTFNGQWTCYSTMGANDATCFVLDGSNTTACVIDCDIIEKHDGSGSAGSNSGLVFLKRGTGVWRMTKAHTHGNKGPILVERGRLEYESIAETNEYCALGRMTKWTTNFYQVADCPAVSFACLLGNGDNTVTDETATMTYTNATGAGVCKTRPLALKGAGRFANDSDYSLSYAGATAAEAGQDATLVLAGQNGGTFTDVTNGVGRLAVVKEGAGTWNLVDGVDIASATAKEGELQIGMNYTFYRWTITANNLGDGGAWIAAFDGFALMDAAGNMLNGTIGKNGMASAKNGVPETLLPGEICYNRYFASTGSRTPDRAFDWDPDTQKFRNTDASIDVTVEKSNASTHPIVYFRPDAGVRVAKYDVMASGNSARDAVCWELAGSVNGKDWDVLHTRETNSLTGYTALTRGQWHSTGTSTRGGWSISSGREGAVFKVGAVRADKDATVAFIGNARGTTVDEIVLDANGGGAIVGASLAEFGTLKLENWSRDKLGTKISFDLSGSTGYDDITYWTIKAGDKTLTHNVLVTADGIKITSRGLMIIVQ